MTGSHNDQVQSTGKVLRYGASEYFYVFSLIPVRPWEEAEGLCGRSLESIKYEANEGRTSCDIGTRHFPSPRNNRSSIQDLDSRVETRGASGSRSNENYQSYLVGPRIQPTIPFDSGAPTFILLAHATMRTLERNI